MDLTVEGKAFVNSIFIDCCIGIKNGKISEIKKILKGDEHIDFGNKLILPAGIDLHVHFRDPGMTHKEDFSTGSLAAAFGGISCVFDMPNTIPQTTTLNSLTNKIATACEKSYIDFGIYAAATDNNINNIEKLAKKCSGFKIFLGTTTNTIHFNKIKLKKILEDIGKTNKIALIHAEDESCLKKNMIIEKNLFDHLHSRPSICEEIAIKDVIAASKGINSKIHICHISSCEGLESLRGKSKNISCGVTPPHSLLSIEKNLENQTLYKVNPPIRYQIDRESLFNGLTNGFVDIIESDHAPHTYDEKCIDFNDAPTGMPAVETMFPLYLYLAKKEILSLQRLILLMCETPAKLIDIPKGKIEVGKDADFIVVDLKDDCKIKSDILHSKCGWSPFEGWPAIFPSHVFIRGEKLIEDNEIQVNQGYGRFVGA
jgi:dihydroorotase